MKLLRDAGRQLRPHLLGLRHLCRLALGARWTTKTTPTPATAATVLRLRDYRHRHRIVTSLGVPFVGVVDLVVHLDGKRTVIDFKTVAKDYDEHRVILSDQLTAYALAHPEAEQVALCVFVKGGAARFAWHVARREPTQIAEYLRKG